MLGVSYEDVGEQLAGVESRKRKILACIGLALAGKARSQKTQSKMDICRTEKGKRTEK
ncbi:unnamed protein product [Sphenostylis stenocarpa]|uniref:Uncharacterized protein n=1 Tax=Sphenostylis stenocarpa TaxID=92480 RepID=A0AA86W1G1_9FABA|nr:unnamed protein product [Sphenostylis stenocarpa]